MRSRVQRPLRDTVSKRFKSSVAKKDLMTRLNEGPVIGDGGFVFALEKRGYVKAGPWTPEACVENPDAVKELHREFARAGSDVMQTFTFYASEDKLDNRGNYAAKDFGVKDINRAACKIAQEVADDYGALVCGGVCQTPTYLSGLGKAKTQDEFRKQCEIFLEEDVDFLLAEYYEHVEECEWAIEALCKEAPNKTIAASLCIGEMGDLHGVSAGDCARKLADAGAKVIGLNCHFGPFELNKGMQQMARALESYPGVHMICQPLGYHTPDAGIQGFIDLPEFPFGLEPRLATRFEMQKWARECYDMGVHYIGGCCGFEPYHIRACTEELLPERNNRNCEGSLKHELEAAGLLMHTKPWVRARASKKYWSDLTPASGRPHSPSLSQPDAWGVTQGDGELLQEFGKKFPTAPRMKGTPAAAGGLGDTHQQQ